MSVPSNGQQLEEYFGILWVCLCTFILQAYGSIMLTTIVAVVVMGLQLFPFVDKFLNPDEQVTTRNA